MKVLANLMGSMSGSIGGMTASHNRAGQYFRRRAVPTNPNTDRQQAVRNIMGGLVQQWQQTLTDEQRNGWIVWADNTPTTDTLGQVLRLTGQNAFVKSNVPRVQAGLAVIATAPVIYNTGQPVIATGGVTEDAGDVSIAGDLGGVTGTAGVVLVYLGRPQSTARTFYKGPYQFALQTAVANNVSTFTVTPAAVASSYPVVVGQVVPYRIRVTYADGRLSTPFEGLSVVAAGA